MKKSGLTVGTQRVVRVSDLSRGGAGVSRDDSGVVIFVPYSAPGDVLKVRILESHKRYAEGEIIEIIEPSPLRQVPRCPAFGRCGGCQWQHLPYDLQFETKVKGVLHALSRAKVPMPDQVEQQPAERIWEYRNRIQLRGDTQGMGFYERNSRDRVNLSRCDIARPEINAVWDEVFEEGKRLKVPFKVEVEVSSTGEVGRAWNSPHSSSGFRQIHDEQNEKLQAWVSEGIGESSVLFDLFGGSGNLSIPLAQRVETIHCVDRSAPLVSPSGLARNIQFHRSSVTPWLFKEVAAWKARKELPKRAAAILDPPREGLGDQIKEIASCLEALNTRKVVAVGCDPDSWARDLANWNQRGWKLQRLVMIDLFPHTSHVESVALLAL